MRSTVITGLLLIQAYTFYYTGMLALSAGLPKPIITLTIIADWITTTKLLNRFSPPKIRPSIGLFFVLSPLFLLPSAISLYRSIILGISPQHILLSVFLTPLIVTTLKSGGLKLTGIASQIIAWILLLLGISFNVGIPFYLAAILSTWGGITISLTPLLTYEQRKHMAP
ncbi:MAG: hypothetical protein QXP58_04965 [Thermoprotei archaeon]